MGPESKFLGTSRTHLKQIGDLALDPSLHLGSSNQELSLLAFPSGSQPIDFLFETVPSRFCLDWPRSGLGLSSKGHGLNLWISSNRIALFYWTLNLGPSSEVALSILVACTGHLVHRNGTAKKVFFVSSRPYSSVAKPSNKGTPSDLTALKMLSNCKFLKIKSKICKSHQLLYEFSNR
jgi:hypothetical protein